MRRRTDRQLASLAVVLSVGLTALTIWAVARQSGALQQREWADLQNAARGDAAERSARWHADLERALATAGEALARAGVEGLDDWIDGRRRWSLAAYVPPSGTTQVVPATPMQEPWPPPGDTRLAVDPAELSESALREALRDFLELDQSADPATRLRAILASAEAHRRLGDPAGAAPYYERALETLRSVPDLARHEFEVTLEWIACLQEAGRQETARRHLKTLLDRIAEAHPARYSPAELELLERRAGPLLDADPETSARWQALRSRARLREAVTELADVAARECSQELDPSAAGTRFFTVTGGGKRLIVAVQRLAAGGCLALATPAAELIARYWEPDDDSVWRIMLVPPDGEEVLCELGPAFGGAVLVPNPHYAQELSAHARRRTILVAVTAAGAAAAWGVVLWMMLRALNRQRELVRLQRRFVADVSHELKTPLAMIRLLAETLQDGRVRDPERARSYYATITREAERLSALIDSILDFSRIESGRKQYEFVECDIGQVARQAWALFEPQFAAGGFTRRLEVADDLPTVRADPSAVQQVLVNLLQNAFRYSGEEKFVRLAVRREGYLIVITVEDHGIGMTRAELARLGDTFFRAEDTRVRKTRGTGLGLAIVNHIVRAHGGKIEVHSRPNKGTTFTVWFPFEPASQT